MAQQSVTVSTSNPTVAVGSAAASTTELVIETGSPLATVAEAILGVSDTEAVTPAGLADALPFPDARQAGVVIDGVTNDRVNLNTYIADCASDDRPCFLRSGIFQIAGGPLVGQGRISGSGRGKTIIRQGDANQGVIDFDSLSDWEVSDLTLQSHASATNVRALLARGEGSGGTMHRVRLVNGGAYIYGGQSTSYSGTAPTTPGIASRVVLDSVWVDDALEYGISLESCQGVDIIAPQVKDCTVDGVKLLGFCDDVTVTGGYATGCGQEGLDSFMGGYNLTIVGFKAIGNTGNGITIKSDDNLDDPGNYQPQGQTTLIGVICRDNTGSGLTIVRNGITDDAAIPLMMHVSLHGGVFEGNTDSGIYLRARNVSLVAPLCRRNGQRGIYVAPEAMDCDIVSPQVSGNSQTTANTYDGISLAGIRNKVIGGFSIGKDADSIDSDGDYAALTAQQRYGVVIVNGSTDCSVHDTVAFGNATGDVTSFGTGGMIRTRTNFQIAGAVEIDGALNHDGTTVGFYGTAPIAKQTGVAVDAAGIHAALVALGLIAA